MRKFLVLLAVAWVATTLGAASVAVERKLTHDLAFLDAAGAANRVSEDWIYGWGTGLAAPLVAVALVAVLAVLSSMDHAPGRFGAFLLAVAGGLSLAYTLSNQGTEERLRSTGAQPLETGLVVATLTLAALLVLVGFTTWLTAPRERYS